MNHVSTSGMSAHAAGSMVLAYRPGSVTGAAPSGRGRSDRRGRRARVARRLTVALAVIGTVTVAGFEFVVPSAADASSRVSQQAASHSESLSSGPVPAKVAAALTATEDAGFTSNVGIDPAGVARWAIGIATGTSTDTGGATIEQQLAKMLYSDGHRRPIDQLEQVGLALRLDAD